MHRSSLYSYCLQYHTAQSCHSINICWIVCAQGYRCSKVQRKEYFPRLHNLCFSAKSSGQRERKIKYGFTFVLCDLEQSSKLSVFSFLFCEIQNKNYIIHKLFSSWFSGSQLQCSPFIKHYSRSHSTQGNKSFAHIKKYFYVCQRSNDDM